MVAGLRLAGATDDDIERLKAERGDVTVLPEEVVCEVYAENWPSVALFMGLATQWRLIVHTIPLPGGAVRVIERRIGLDYPGVEVEMRMQGLRLAERQVMWQHLKVMEAAVLNGEAKARTAEAARHG